MASGLILEHKIGNGMLTLVQLKPDMFKDAEPYHTQIATQRLNQLTAQLLTAYGFSSSADLSQRLNTIQSGAQYQWLKNWQVLGPIKTTGKATVDLDTVFPGQKAAVAGDTNPNFFYQQADGRNLDFRKTVTAYANGFVDLGAVVDMADGNLAYATRTLNSETDRTALLRIGVDYWCDVYLNGKLVYRVAQGHSSPRANHLAVKLKLKKGANILTFKVISGSKGFGFWANLSMGDHLEQVKQQKEVVQFYTPLPHPFDPYEYHYW